MLAAQQGDSDAFGQLYKANEERVYRYLLSRTGNQADAEDITSEVFFRAIRGLQGYESRGVRFAAWLLRIAHNEAINFAKKRDRRREVVFESEVSTSDNPEEAALAIAEYDEVLRAMSGLTDLQRQALGLRFAAGLSLAETAHAMDRSIEAVKRLQYRALRALRRVMAGKGRGGRAR